MHGIMQAGIEAVRGDERGHARDHAGWIGAVRGEERGHEGDHADWDGSSEGRGERSCTVSCMMG